MKSKANFNFFWGGVLLSIFAFFRPLILGFARIGSLNVLEVFGIIISIMFLIAILININKFSIDSLSFLILFFCSYVLFSILWGSSTKEVIRITFPFLLFFIIKTTIDSDNQISFLLIILIIGYSYLILSSTYLIAFGKSEILYDYYADIEKHQGATIGSHSLGHSMLFFSVAFSYYIILNNMKNVITKYLFFFLLLLSFYCLFKSQVRTAIIGQIIYWLIFLWKYNKKLIFILIFISIALLNFYEKDIFNILFKLDRDQTINKYDIDIDRSSSGRIFIWTTDFDIFTKLTTEEKLLGLGLGSEGKKDDNSGVNYIPAHNDYLSLLMSLGIIGLFIYISILIMLIKNVLLLDSSDNSKHMFLGLIISVSIMNFLSNSSIGRFEMAQLFWFFMGLLYFKYRSINNKKA